MASKNTSYFPADHNSGNVYRLADNFSFATSVLLGVDILLQLWKRISISTHLELDDRWHDSCEATIKFPGTTCIFKQCLVSINGSYDKEIFSVWLTECNSLQADIGKLKKIEHFIICLRCSPSYKTGHFTSSKGRGSL